MKLNKVIPFSLFFFGIYIDKLEKCLEEAGCVGTILARMVIILLLYVDDIVLMARCSSDLDKQSWIVKYFCSKFITSSIGTIALRKGLMEGGKLILVLKISVNQPIWSCGIKEVHLWNSFHPCYLVWLWSMGVHHF